MTNQQSNQMLDQIQNAMIQAANASGVNLADHFDTVDEFKTFIISFTFQQLIEQGVSVEEATNMTLGENAYQNIYEMCKAKA